MLRAAVADHKVFSVEPGRMERWYDSMYEGSHLLIDGTRTL